MKRHRYTHEQIIRNLGEAAWACCRSSGVIRLGSVIRHP